MYIQFYCACAHTGSHTFADLAHVLKNTGRGVSLGTRSLCGNSMLILVLVEGVSLLNLLLEVAPKRLESTDSPSSQWIIICTFCKMLMYVDCKSKCSFYGCSQVMQVYC